MKTPGPTKAEPSAPNSANSIGQYPVRHATVAAEVLRRLLKGERLTSLTAVFDSSTTRLAAVIHRLDKEHGWQIDRTSMAVGTRDGRVTDVAEYFLKPSIITAAFGAGAGQFCADVEEARAQQRGHAEKARKLAEQRNNSARIRLAQGGAA